MCLFMSSVLHELSALNSKTKADRLSFNRENGGI